MTDTANTTAQLNFKEIKTAANVTDVLAHFELLEALTQRTTKQGKELVGWCPLGTKRHGKRDSFSINPESKIFQCFACKEKGTILDFVALVAKLHIRDAAALVAQISTGTSPEPRQEAPGTPTAVSRGKTGRKYPQWPSTRSWRPWRPMSAGN